MFSSMIVQLAVTKAVAEPPKPVEKSPIPAENQILQEVLDKLASQCLGKAANAVSGSILIAASIAPSVVGRITSRQIHSVAIHVSLWLT